jgi:hypothetical protein
MKSQRADTNQSRPKVSGEARPWWVWLDVAPAALLAVVISAYSVVAAYPASPTRAPVPGVEAADALALPFLVLTLAAGIIRYVCAPPIDAPAQAVSASPTSKPRDTP